MAAFILFLSDKVQSLIESSKLIVWWRVKRGTHVVGEVFVFEEEIKHAECNDSFHDFVENAS